MITLTKLKKNLSESCGYLDSFVYQDNRVVITSDLKVSINEEILEVEFKNLEEAREYSKSYINNSIILKDIDAVIPEEKIVNLISKYHDSIKITDKIVESYVDLASSNLFTVDPVVAAIKERTAVEFSGKFEYKLNDGSTVAINEDTQDTLNNLLQNKPEIVDYMREFEARRG